MSLPSRKQAACASGLTQPIPLTPKVQRRMTSILKGCCGCDVALKRRPRHKTKLCAKAFRFPYPRQYRNHATPEAAARIHALRGVTCRPPSARCCIDTVACTTGMYAAKRKRSARRVCRIVRSRSAPKIERSRSTPTGYLRVVERTSALHPDVPSHNLAAQ